MLFPCTIWSVKYVVNATGILELGWYVGNKHLFGIILDSSSCLGIDNLNYRGAVKQRGISVSRHRVISTLLVGHSFPKRDKYIGAASFAWQSKVTVYSLACDILSREQISHLFSEATTRFPFDATFYTGVLDNVGLFFWQSPPLVSPWQSWFSSRNWFHMSCKTDVVWCTNVLCPPGNCSWWRPHIALPVHVSHLVLSSNSVMILTTSGHDIIQRLSAPKSFVKPTTSADHYCVHWTDQLPSWKTCFSFCVQRTFLQSALQRRREDFLAMGNVHWWSSSLVGLVIQTGMQTFMALSCSAFLHRDRDYLHATI